MTRLPGLLDTADLALAELHAAKLDGLVLPLGDVFRPIDLPEGRDDRAASLGRMLPAGLVVCEESAAWVWCGGTPPDPVRTCVRPQTGGRHASSRGLVVREVALRAGETVGLGPIELTAPVRTACDLAAAAERPSAHAALTTTLATGLVCAQDVESALRGRRRQRSRIVALTALAAAAAEARAQPLLTR